MKEELKNANEEIKYLKEKETVENSDGKSEDEFSCNICDMSFKSKKKLKIHNQSDHNPWIKCDSCDATFEKICDLEVHVEITHDSVEKFQCEKCCKTFVLKWRFKKHQELHTNTQIRRCHSFNNQKHCPLYKKY